MEPERPVDAPHRPLAELLVHHARNPDLAGGDVLNGDLFRGERWNITAATPELVRIPAPTAETVHSPPSMRKRLRTQTRCDRLQHRVHFGQVSLVKREGQADRAGSIVFLDDVVNRDVRWAIGVNTAD